MFTLGVCQQSFILDHRGRFVQSWREENHWSSRYEHESSTYDEAQPPGSDPAGVTLVDPRICSNKVTFKVT